MFGTESREHRDTEHRDEDLGSEGVKEEGSTVRALRTNRPSRRFSTVVGSVAVAALLLSTIWVLSSTRGGEVTVVAIIPLSGSSSYLVEIEEAMRLTVEKLNKWGGLNGKRIRLVVEDCGSSPELAVEKLHEAEDEYHPLAVITSTRGAAVPMAEFAEENGIILISVGATNENLTEDRDWVFRYYVTPTGEADIAFETLENLNVSSLGILHLDDAYGNPVANRLTEAFEASGGTVESYGFSANRTEFSEAVANLTDNDAVFAVALRHQFQVIFQELNSSGYIGHVLGGVEASIPDTWDLPEAQGAFVSAPIMYSETAAIDRAFLAEFEDRYGRQLTHQGAIGSDALRLIWGLLSDSEVSRENLRSLLSGGFVYSGILGVVNLRQGAHNADIAVYPAVIEGGSLRYL